MKTKTLITLFAALLTGGLFSQVVDIDPITNGIFYDTVDLMSQSNQSLYQNHDSQPVESIYFTTNFTDSNFYVDEDSQFFNESATSLGVDFYFTKIATNVEAFAAKGTSTIGFFGNSSNDNNKLLVKGFDNNENQIQNNLIFDYAKSPSTSVTPAPTAYEVSGDANAPINSNYSYWHDNPVKGATYQGNENRFAMFQSYNPFTQELSNEWIFAIDDREDDLIDYDDGFFYVTGDLTPVPEPSLVGFLAVLGVIGIVFFNNRKKSNNTK